MKNTQDVIKHLIDAGKKEGVIDTNQISDGYHTFGELYEHRIALFRALCSMTLDMDCEQGAPDSAWKSKLHSDGSGFDGWFIAGINTEPGDQMTYHIPMSEWDKWPGKELGAAPEWDGHTSADVLERLKSL